MNELKKKIRDFYIVFGIDTPIALFLLALFNVENMSDFSPYLIFLGAIIVIAYYKYKNLKKLLSEFPDQENSNPPDKG